ncbi:MAG TPA: glycosyltransferase [Candidatus Binatia bacterium]|nr:glycosyltransferase [Candidatus Binatia bacterium]
MKHLSEGVLEETRCSPSTCPTSSPAYFPISVVVPVHNGGENFRHCLASLTATVPPPEEIIVVADGDTDGSWQLAKEFGAQVLRIPGPGGPARARNLGARTAHGDILFFVDADVIVPPDALRQIVEAFAQEPDLAAVFGSYDDTPAASNFLSQYKNLFHHYVHQTACEDASTFWGACGAIRREVFLALGGFDEQYRYPSIEDIEFGFRLKQASGKILLRKALQVKHLKRWGVASLLKADIFHRALPWTELIMRERHLPNDLNLRLSSRVSIALTYGLLLTVLGSWWWPRLLVVAGVMAFSLLLLNTQVYGFFWRKRGLRFTLQVVPWHWLYYFYSGLAFAIGSASFLLRRGSLVKTSAVTVPEEQPPSGRVAE